MESCSEEKIDSQKTFAWSSVSSLLNVVDHKKIHVSIRKWISGDNWYC